MKFGLKAEGWIVEILKQNGTEVRRATRTEDRMLKVDFWVKYNGYWLPVQFSVDRENILNGKGLDALQRGIVPMWIDGLELEIALTNGNGNGLVREFWIRVEKILEAYPKLKRFWQPKWKREFVLDR